MNALTSVIDAQKRKRQDAGPLASKFQRRGDVRNAQSTEPTTSPHVSLQSQLNTTTPQETPQADQSTSNPSQPDQTTSPLVHTHSAESTPPQPPSNQDREASKLTEQPTTTAPLDSTSQLPDQSAESLETQRLQHLQRLQQLQHVREQKYKEEPDKSTFEDPFEYLLFSTKRYLWFWEQDIAAYSPQEADSFLGKQNQRDYAGARKSLRPFFQQCKDRTLRRELETALTNVFEELSAKEYIKAQQAFYEVAIGNNPWPLGLPKVGIHERQAREKIDPSLIDHLLKDPVIQEFMQAIKRLMSYVQQRFP